MEKNNRSICKAEESAFAGQKLARGGKQNMKKIFTVVLATLMLITLVSCGGGNTTQNNTGILDIGDFSYEFKGYELVKDDYDADVILLCYDFTNKSEEACSFFASGFYEAIQAEETLNSTTIYVSEDSMEAVTDAEMEEIEPGETLEVTLAYELIDKTSPVTVNFASIFTGKEASHTVDITTGAANANTAVDDNDGNTITEVVEDPNSLANSQWYGWWMIVDATGDYEDYDGEYYDCCATFERTNEGYILMSIWDETYPDYEDECLGEVYFEEIDGMLVSAEGGFFYTGEAVGEGQMVIDKDFSDFEHTLFTYANIEDEYGSFVAAISLTEWGYEWDEEFNDYPTYYDSYFLPLMEEGKALPANISDIG